MIRRLLRALGAVQRSRHYGVAGDEAAARLVLYPQSRRLEVLPRGPGR